MTTINEIERLLNELDYGAKPLNRFYSARKVSTQVIHDLKEVLMDFKKLKAKQLREDRKEKFWASRGGAVRKVTGSPGAVIYDPARPDQIIIDGQYLKLLNRSWDQLEDRVWIDYNQELFYADIKTGNARVLTRIAPEKRALLASNRVTLEATLRNYIVEWFRNRNLAKLARDARKRDILMSQKVVDSQFPAMARHRQRARRANSIRASAPVTTNDDFVAFDMLTLLAVNRPEMIAGKCRCRPNSSFARYRPEQKDTTFNWSWTHRGTIKIEHFDYSCTMTPGRFLREFVGVG